MYLPKELLLFFRENTSLLALRHRVCTIHSPAADGLLEEDNFPWQKCHKYLFQWIDILNLCDMGYERRVRFSGYAFDGRCWILHIASNDKS